MSIVTIIQPLTNHTLGTGIGGSTYFFVFLIIFITALIGVLGRSFGLGIFGGWLSFTHFAQGTGDEILMAVMYITLSMLIIVGSFKVWGLIGSNGGEI